MIWLMSQTGYQPSIFWREETCLPSKKRLMEWICGTPFRMARSRQGPWYGYFPCLKKVWIFLFSLCLYGVIRDCFDLNIASIGIGSKLPRCNSSQSEKKAEPISVFPRLTPVARSCFAGWLAHLIACTCCDRPNFGLGFTTSSLKSSKCGFWREPIFLSGSS